MGRYDIDREKIGSSETVADDALTGYTAVINAVKNEDDTIADDAKPDATTVAAAVQAAQAGVWGEVSSAANVASACFAAGTPIRVPGGWKNIEDIQEGDFVLARDEFDPDGPVIPRRVETTYVRTGTKCELSINGRVIVTTPEHPFHAHGKGWTAAGALTEGMQLDSLDGPTVTVDRVRSSADFIKVYNLTVSESHTYFVGEDTWGWSAWAHNYGGNGGGSTSGVTVDNNIAFDEWLFSTEVSLTIVFSANDLATNATWAYASNSCHVTITLPQGATTDQCNAAIAAINQIGANNKFNSVILAGHGSPGSFAFVNSANLADPNSNASRLIGALADNLAGGSTVDIRACSVAGENSLSPGRRLFARISALLGGVSVTGYTDTYNIWPVGDAYTSYGGTPILTRSYTKYNDSWVGKIQRNMAK